MPAVKDCGHGLWCTFVIQKFMVVMAEDSIARREDIGTRSVLSILRYEASW